MIHDDEHHVRITTSTGISTTTDDTKSGTSHGEKKGHRKISDLSQGPGLLEMVAGDDPEDLDAFILGARSSSVIKFYPDWCKCFKCLMRNENNTGSDTTIRHQIVDFFECPPRGTMGRILVFSFLFTAIWGLFYYLFKPMSEEVQGNHGILKPDKDRNPAWVKGPLFALMLVEITGLFTGVILKRFLNFPALLGPLVLGIVYNNFPPLNLFNLMKGFEWRSCTGDVDAINLCERMAVHTINTWVKPIRMIALAIILTRAGIELSPKQLKKLKGIVPLLAFGPCIVEACTCAGLNYLFFNHMMVTVPDDQKMSVPMCFVGGFALAAVSPAVVVPGALSLKRDGYGVMKGVPTLLIAASSIDDVLAISIYTIALGLAVQEGELAPWQVYSGGCIGIAVGLIHGMVFGILLHFIPPQKSKNKPQNRLVLLLMLNFMSVLAYEETWFNSAGSISVLVTSFIAGFGWRSQHHWKRPMHKIEGWLAHLWVLWVPLIFGTIGKEINFSGESFQGELLGKTFGVIFISLTARCLAAFFLVSLGTGFNKKERLFIALSWIPKATVQAALAPLVLIRVAIASESTTVSKDVQNALMSNATIVVNIAILAVLITAPSGCILIALTGPRLLQQYRTPHSIIEEEFPNGEGFDPAESTYGIVVPAHSLKPGSTGSLPDVRVLNTVTDDVGVQAYSVKKINSEPIE